MGPDTHDINTTGRDFPNYRTDLGGSDIQSYDQMIFQSRRTPFLFLWFLMFISTSDIAIRLLFSDSLEGFRPKAMNDNPLAELEGNPIQKDLVGPFLKLGPNPFQTLDPHRNFFFP